MSDLQQAHDQFIDEALWHGSLEKPAALLAEHPAIATRSIYAAAILGDARTVRELIARDRTAVTEKGGPRGWDALTYLCFSKFLRLEPARTPGFVDSATALLDAGADPNTGFYATEERTPQDWESALYGASGVAHNPELTRLLVDRGADPNDGEVAYHSPETLDNRTVQVLVESGKLTQDSLRLMLARKMNWHDDNGFAWLLDHGTDPNYVGTWKTRPLDDALHNGCPIHYFEQLLDHGADPSLPSKNGRSIFAGAARMARVDVLDLLERRGFKVQLGGDDAFLAACARADAPAARRMVAADPDLVRRVQSRDPTTLIEYAGADNRAAVGLLLDLGFDIGVARTEPRWSRGLTALHEATGHARLETVKLLIAQGAPLDSRHEQSGRTPADTALLCITEQSEWTPHQDSVLIARALLDAGTPFNEENMTLAAAVCLGRQQDVERLTPTATREDKQIALAAAAFNASVEGLRAVIRLGVDLDATDPGLEHAAPLHNAVSSGSLAAVKALVVAGARLDTRDLAYHLKPVDWAEWYAKNRAPGEYAAIVEYLKALGSSDAP
jgi:ankyrin repeat protein